ncbi:hypothetical protein L6V77_31365 [Myxococcota bacterium]|nr:hypothetical protein [Myxococcota bacterium]
MRSFPARLLAPLGLGLALALVLLPGLAFAQNVHVAIVSIRGKGGGATAVQGLQAAVQKLRGITFESARNFLAEAEQRGVADRVESDPKAIGQVARTLAVDAVVIGSLDEGRRSKARVLTLTVHNGGDGKRLGEEVVEVPGGKLTPKIFTTAARAIEPYLRMGDHKAAGLAGAATEAPRDEPPPRDEAAVTDTPPPADDDDGFDRPAPRGRRPDFLRVSAGLALRSRTFDYKTAAEPTGADRAPNTEYVLPDGISYSSSMAPGFGLAAEVYPLALSFDNALAGIGLTVGFEQVFLTSKQTITTDVPPGTVAAPTENETAELETTQRVLDLGLRYRHAFGSGQTAPEAFGGFGMTFTTFELEKNPEYRGTNYSYPHVDLGGRIPFGTPLAAAELTFRYIPTADMGDTTQELGADATLSGFGLVADLVSHLAGGLMLVAGVEYTSISGDVSGEGRATEYLDADGATQLRRVRLGKSVEDSYLGIHARAGYRF